MAPSWLAQAGHRALLSLTTIPNLGQSINVALITIATTATSGLVAVVSGFTDPTRDFDPPWRRRDSNDSLMCICCRSLKPVTAFIFPSLAEEVLWRGILIAPHPSTIVPISQLLPRAGLVLGVHVMMHPIAGYTCWPRGRNVFCDWRFLLSATFVLGGATLSYLASGGSVWAAALTHGLVVALWRDFLGGEALLMSKNIQNDSNVGEKKLNNDN